jgi:hypothetical protein
MTIAIIEYYQKMKFKNVEEEKIASNENETASS